MNAIGRRKLVLGASALTLTAACSPAGGTTSNSDDMVLGDPNSRVTLIEYASTTCGACRAFHESTFPQLKANYIDTRKIKFVFREYPTAPAPLAVAGFQIARCNNATPEQYISRVSTLFQRQQEIFSAGSMPNARLKLIEIGGTSGVSESQATACIADEAGGVRVSRVMAAGEREFHITGTPTLILNGTKLDQSRDPSVVTYAGLSRLIDAALGGA